MDEALWWMDGNRYIGVDVARDGFPWLTDD